MVSAVRGDFEAAADDPQKLMALPVEASLPSAEPSDLEGIRARREPGFVRYTVLGQSC